jgi:competence protein ComEA
VWPSGPARRTDPGWSGGPRWPGGSGWPAGGGAVGVHGGPCEGPAPAAAVTAVEAPAWDDAQEQPDEGVPADPGAHRQGRGGRAVGRWLPEGWRGARLDPGRPGATALALVAAAAAVVAAVGVWSDRPRAEPITALPSVVATGEPVPAAGGAVASGAPGQPETPATLVVSVAGKVGRPGLVRVPAGARVAEAIEAAGGPLPGTDLTGLNLARRLGDGEQVAVGVPAAPDAAGPDLGLAAGPGAGGDGTPARVDLNAATAEQLETLPGVGPVTAERILEWRNRNGPFSRVEQLREVNGIGERRFSTLRDLVSV